MIDHVIILTIILETREMISSGAKVTADETTSLPAMETTIHVELT
jgi:hypothetical protein